MKKRRFLITGGYGFIGSCLIRELINEDGVEICNIDKLSYSSNLNSFNHASTTNYQFKKIDIVNSKLIEEAIREFKPDYIIHLAAETHVDRSIDGPDAFIQSNIIGTYNLLNSSYEFWKKLESSKKEIFKFLYVSTDEVYGSLGPNDNPFTEESNYKPNSPYSATKAAGDHLVRAWNKTYSLPVIITNTCNNYGPFQFPEKLIPLVIKKCLSKEPIPIYGDGKQIRDWIRVEDHVSGILKALDKGTCGEKYNIGSNCELTNIQVVSDICMLLDRLKPNEDKSSYLDLITFVEDRPGHDNRYSIDNMKITNLNWKPKFSWENGLKDTVEWYLANKEFLKETNKENYLGDRLGKL